MDPSVRSLSVGKKTLKLLVLVTAGGAIVGWLVMRMQALEPFPAAIVKAGRVYRSAEDCFFERSPMPGPPPGEPIEVREVAWGKDYPCFRALHRGTAFFVTSDLFERRSSGAAE
jgi:hypothetical protein